MFARVEGIDYTPQSVEAIRAEVIKVRGEALTQGIFDMAVALSWAIAFLAEYGDILSDPERGRHRRTEASPRPEAAHLMADLGDAQWVHDGPPEPRAKSGPPRL
jgi:hypothetical protein